MSVESNFKYIYGPVHSWRLGMSLGIDPLSDKSKICNMDCVYCQLGKTVYWSHERKVYVPTEAILKEIKQLPDMPLDYITFSGRGEPTLALNLGEMIKKIRKLRKEKIAVITNSLLMSDPQLRKDLCLADFVLAKLDAGNQESLQKVDKVIAGIDFDVVVEGIKQFRKEFKGKLALQLMFVDINQDQAEAMAAVARKIQADEVEINTPLRPSAAKPLTPEALLKIKKVFHGLNAKTVYEMERKSVKPMNERDTIKRHGNYKKTREA